MTRASIEGTGRQPDAKVKDAVDNPATMAHDNISFLSFSHIIDGPQYNGGQHPIIENNEDAITFDASTSRISMVTEDTTSTLCDNRSCPDPKYDNIGAEFKQADDDTALISGIIEGAFGETQLKKNQRPKRAWVREGILLGKLVAAVTHQVKEKKKGPKKLNAWRRQAIESGLITREQALEKRCWAVEARFFGRLVDAVEHELYSEEPEPELNAGQAASNAETDELTETVIAWPESERQRLESNPLSDESIKSVIARAESRRERLCDEFIEDVISQAEARRISEEAIDSEAKANEVVAPHSTKITRASVGPSNPYPSSQDAVLPPSFAAAGEIPALAITRPSSSAAGQITSSGDVLPDGKRRKSSKPHYDFSRVLPPSFSAVEREMSAQKVDSALIELDSRNATPALSASKASQDELRPLSDRDVPEGIVPPGATEEPSEPKVRKKPDFDFSRYIQPHLLSSSSAPLSRHAFRSRRSDPIPSTRPARLRPETMVRYCYFLF